MQTPSFLVWALARRCHLRQIADWESPERTERLLRAAWAYDEARVEFRILDGIAFSAGAESETTLASVRGFSVAAALKLYGGIDGLNAACNSCEANALRGHRGRSLVGCFGMWPLPENPSLFYQQVDMAIASGACDSTTQPGWFGLWMSSPLLAEDSCARARLLRELRIDDPASDSGRMELAIALETAAQYQIPLHVQLYPPGQVDGPWWKLVPHCGRCQAPWMEGGICQVCRHTRHPASAKKRRARGTRPYHPLTQLVDSKRAAETWVRYKSHRGGQFSR